MGYIGETGVFCHFSPKISYLNQILDGDEHASLGMSHVHHNMQAKSLEQIDSKIKKEKRYTVDFGIFCIWPKLQGWNSRLLILVTI